MDLKKSKKANLERKKGTSFVIGLIVSLSLILISFEWTSATDGNEDLLFAREIFYEAETMELIPRDEPKPEIKKDLPTIADVLEIVDDDFILDEDYDFSNEITKDFAYDFSIISNDKPEVIKDTLPFVVVEDMPTFNGGDPYIEFRKYIAGNLVYPEIAIENGIGGRVDVQFIVNSTGSVTNVKITRSVDPALDKEALRVINSSPKWSPGRQRGKAVDVIYTFPINFVLQ